MMKNEYFEQNELRSIRICIKILVPNLEEEVEKLADKDGWIKRADYVKFTSTTDLFKVEFHDRVFQKFDLEEEIDKKKGSSRKEPLKRVS